MKKGFMHQLSRKASLLKKRVLKNRRRCAIFIIFSTLIVLAIPLYIARGWIRGPFGTSIVTRLYADDVERTYAEHVSVIDKKLEMAGFSIEGDGSVECMDGNFSKLRETFYCFNMVSGKAELSNDIVALFQAQEGASQMQSFMLDNGWAPDRELLFEYPSFAVYDDLGKLIDDKVGHTSVDFEKTIDGVHCAYHFSYYSAINTYENTVAVIGTNQRCDKDINIFGGYQL